jgi:aminopeptidase N
MALAVLMRGRRDRDARDVRERLERLLGDRDCRVQAAAIEALAIVGDPAAIAALHRMIDRELDGRLRRRGKEVIRDLENGTSGGEDLRRMRDELGELRALTGALRERLELLEAKTGDGTAKPPRTSSKPAARRPAGKKPTPAAKKAKATPSRR